MQEQECFFRLFYRDKPTGKVFAVCRLENNILIIPQDPAQRRRIDQGTTIQAISLASFSQRQVFQSFKQQIGLTYACLGQQQFGRVCRADLRKTENCGYAINCQSAAKTQREAVPGSYVGLTKDGELRFHAKAGRRAGK